MEFEPRDSYETNWNSLVNSIDTVASLPSDDRFHNELDSRSIHKSVVFEQVGDIICFDASELFRGSQLLHDFEENRHVVISECTITTSLRGGFYFCEGSLTIDGKELSIKSEDGRLFLYEDLDLPPTEITPDDISNLFLALAGSYIDEKQSDVETILTESEANSSDPWQKLAAIQSHIGNLFGVSTTTTRSLFVEGVSFDEGIIVELVEVETPDGSNIHNELVLKRNTGIMSDAINIEGHTGTPADDPSLESVHYARQALYADSGRYRILEEAARESISLKNRPDMPTLTSEYYPSGHNEARDVQLYAKLCQSFLDIYEKIIATQP